MLTALLSSAPPDRPAIVSSEGTVSWSQLRQLAEQLGGEFERLRRLPVGVILPANAAGLAALCALDRLEAHAYLLDEHLPPETVDDWAERFDLRAIMFHERDFGWRVRHLKAQISNLRFANREPAGSAAAARSAVTILTSGTEGTPKAATYTWDSLAGPVRTGQLADRDVWLLSFRIHLYAGLQVVLQALVNGQTLVVPDQQMTPDEVASLMADSGVTCASATPSYWRRLILFAEANKMARIPLRQITLGGELADQAILDALRSIYPAARIVHIYATTELGRCFAVTDGKAGFPRSYLQAEPGESLTRVSARLKVVDGQLLVQPTHGMLDLAGPTATTVDQQHQAWIATGDLVELQGDRVLFAGRAGDMINVGGNKVRPAIVEEAIRSVPGVLDVRVYGKSSSIAGQLVACELVVAQGHDEHQTRTAIGATCRAQLQPYECPRLIEIVKQIEMTPAGKVARREAN